MNITKVLTGILFAVTCAMQPGLTQPLDQIKPRNSEFEKLGLPRRLIAIDNVCAWPNLTMLKDSTIIATIYNQPNHGYFEGDAECWSSQDKGLTWEYSGTPTNHAPFTNRMNVAAGINQMEELVVLCSGWDKINPRRNSESKPLTSTISISKDGGRTWEVGGLMPPPVVGLSEHVPFSDIIVAENGDLVVGTYAFEMRDKMTPANQRKGHIYLLRSEDNGKSWNKVIPIIKGTHVEAAILHIGKGKWLSVSRRFGHLDLDIHKSDDDGFTWEHVSVLGIPKVSSAHLLQLSDGRIMLSYGNRSLGNKGIDVRISNDQGITWSSPQRILDLKESRDLGYPAALEFDNGQIVIAYYSSGIQQHDRYHMGVVNLHISELIEY